MSAVIVILGKADLSQQGIPEALKEKAWKTVPRRHRLPQEISRANLIFISDVQLTQFASHAKLEPRFVHSLSDCDHHYVAAPQLDGWRACGGHTSPSLHSFPVPFLKG